MERQSLILTTSWDDGHPMDYRLAELMGTYGIRGTFYIPRKSERYTINEKCIRELSTRFEVGAHTMNHVELPLLAPEDAHREIVDSKLWIESVTGKECLSLIHI